MTVVVAKDSLIADGGQRFIARGALVDSADAVVKANPDMFRTVDEAAKAAPDFIAGTKVEEPDEKPARAKRA